MALTLREADLSDAERLGPLHVAAWRETYDGLLPDEIMADMSVERRTAQWAKILSGAGAARETFVCVLEDEEQLVGFGSCGAQRDRKLEAMGFGGEFSAIYVLQSHQRRRAGTAVLRRMAVELSALGHEAATLWVLRENDVARAFYERMGGEVIGEKEEVRRETSLVELAYGWRALARLSSLPSLS